MERLEKQLKINGNFGSFLQVICSNFDLNSGKVLKVTKIVGKKISFKGSSTSYNKKKAFQRQSLKNYMRLTIVFMRNSTL